MSKTIKQSVDSLSSSATSLESSLTKCKTSIKNKGVNVPTTTTFSGLPDLIDKIKTEETYSIRIYYSTEEVGVGRFRWVLKGTSVSNNKTYYSSEFQVTSSGLSSTVEHTDISGLPGGNYNISLENLNTKKIYPLETSTSVGDIEYECPKTKLIIVFDRETLSDVYINNVSVKNMREGSMISEDIFGLETNYDTTKTYTVTSKNTSGQKRKYNDTFTLTDLNSTYVLDVKAIGYYLYRINNYGHTSTLKLGTSYKVVS